MSNIMSTIIFVVREVYKSEESKVIKVELLEGGVHRIGTMNDFASMGLEPDSLIGLSVQQATEIVESLNTAVKIRTVLVKKGVINNEDFNGCGPFILPPDLPF